MGIKTDGFEVLSKRIQMDIVYEKERKKLIKEHKKQELALMKAHGKSKTEDQRDWERILKYRQNENRMLEKEEAELINKLKHNKEEQLQTEEEIRVLECRIQNEWTRLYKKNDEQDINVSQSQNNGCQ